MSRAELAAVLPIILGRSAQVGISGAIVLLLLHFFVPSIVFWWLVVIGGVSVTLGLSVYFVAIFSPRTHFGFPLLTTLPTSAIALTFDDGPHPETTPVILEILARYTVKATFFLVAERAAMYPELTRRIAAEGHTIGVHGLRHRAMVLQSAKQIATDLGEAECIFEGILGKPLPERLLRPPHGFKTATLCRTAHRLDWTIVAWSCDSRDYDPITGEEIVKNVLTGVSTGDIVLLHEQPGRTATLEALPQLLQGKIRWGTIVALTPQPPLPKLGERG